jgi:hypothetical protein
MVDRCRSTALSGLRGPTGTGIDHDHRYDPQDHERNPKPHEERVRLAELCSRDDAGNASREKYLPPVELHSEEADAFRIAVELHVPSFHAIDTTTQWDSQILSTRSYIQGRSVNVETAPRDDFGPV